MRKHIHHIHIIMLIALLTFTVILLAGNILIEKSYLAKPVFWGVSFSPDYAAALELDPKQTFESILDLGVKNFRLSAYWDQIEPERDHFEFNDLDYYIKQAKKHNSKVILAVGYKLPRWPECRAPHWLKTNELRERQLIMVRRTIEYYNEDTTISAFQIENEPLLPFGNCPPVDRKFLHEEINMVKSISKKPVIITDGGEFRPWRTPMMLSDIFGTTLYRKVYSRRFGDFYYPIPPWAYRVKSDLVKKVIAPENQKTIIAELQAEVWAGTDVKNIPISDQIDRFSLDELKNNIHFARKSGFDEIYLWGIEWWYYLAKNGHPEYLEYAKGLF